MYRSFVMSSTDSVFVVLESFNSPKSYKFSNIPFRKRQVETKEKIPNTSKTLKHSQGKSAKICYNNVKHSHRNENKVESYIVEFVDIDEINGTQCITTCIYYSKDYLNFDDELCIDNQKR